MFSHYKHTKFIFLKIGKRNDGLLLINYKSMTGIHNVHEIFKVVTGVVKITLLKSFKCYVGLQVITGHISTA